MDEFFALLFFFDVTSLIGEFLMYFGERERDGNYVRLQCFFLFLVGVCIGIISLKIFLKPMILTSWFRIVAALAAPFLVGCVSKFIAEYVSRKKDDVWPQRHFWYSFSICAGCVLVRFVCSVR
ncbi:MAG: hypothetical protein HQL21_05365 [Candidatus Omnitrophica bacterium]|nr:hypothetical protein [Candidatus Omnitrophota bacterium]